MARRALILVGDSTSHGGVVLEGADTDTLNGRAIACVGHRVSCPKCKGDFPIVPDGSGGHVLPWIGGLNVAVEGMQTACGATLIASQQAFVVDEAPPAPAQPEAPRAPPPSGLGLCLECLRHAAIHGEVSVLRSEA
ncbi:MAG: PAAR domain-containing protein [Betaproteobacteria bacterium]|nr:PAAR domain-containing protein [Betaproteobacteria bacterium]MBU6510759.1 PAAR domain-containing protein [Betaproteobacteria bacterium]MDE1956616.1 PAAR domain-containing protein [Betaproteobacteria bacterium]MDE2150882.1 PAAR domain-containing protein [Betaproteobacteria bacterium]